nr:MAG TPA: hypothetical protein [Caudoviricetes sp.]
MQYFKREKNEDSTIYSPNYICWYTLVYLVSLCPQRKVPIHREWSLCC